MLGMRCMRPADLAATAPRRRLGPSPPACGAPVLQRHLPLRPAPDPGGVGQLQMAHGAGTRDCGGGDRGRRRRDRLQGGLGSPLLLALKQAQWAGGGGGRAILGNHGAQGLWAQHRGVLRPSAATIAAHCAPSLLTPPPTHTHTHTPAAQAGDHAGVGCMVDSCGECEQCKEGDEQYCPSCIFTYNSTAPDGTITQGGYSTHVVVKSRCGAAGGACTEPAGRCRIVCCRLSLRVPLPRWLAGTRQPPSPATGVEPAHPPALPGPHAQLCRAGGQEPAAGRGGAAAVRRHHHLLAFEVLWPGGWAGL